MGGRVREDGEHVRAACKNCQSLVNITGSTLLYCLGIEAYPWSALTLDADNRRFILDVPKERLQNAPGFDKDHWPAMADQR